MENEVTKPNTNKKVKVLVKKKGGATDVKRKVLVKKPNSSSQKKQYSYGDKTKVNTAYGKSHGYNAAKKNDGKKSYEKKNSAVKGKRPNTKEQKLDVKKLLNACVQTALTKFRRTGVRTVLFHFDKKDKYFNETIKFFDENTKPVIEKMRRNKEIFGKTFCIKINVSKIKNHKDEKVMSLTCFDSWRKDEISIGVLDGKIAYSKEKNKAKEEKIMFGKNLYPKTSAKKLQGKGKPNNKKFNNKKGDYKANGRTEKNYTK